MADVIALRFYFRSPHKKEKSVKKLVSVSNKPVRERFYQGRILNRNGVLEADIETSFAMSH